MSVVKVKPEVLQVLNASDWETTKLVSVSILLWTHCPLFPLSPPAFSLPPVHPGKQSRSEGWINKGVKVEHNSLRSAFSGTLTQRKRERRTHNMTTYSTLRPRNTHRNVKLTCAERHMHLFEHYWGDEMRRGGDIERENKIHTSKRSCLRVGGKTRRKGGVRKGGDWGWKGEGRARATWGGMPKAVKLTMVPYSLWFLLSSLQIISLSLFVISLLFSFVPSQTPSFTVSPHSFYSLSLSLYLLSSPWPLSSLYFSFLLLSPLPFPLSPFILRPLIWMIWKNCLLD